MKQRKTRNVDDIECKSNLLGRIAFLASLSRPSVVGDSRKENLSLVDEISPSGKVPQEKV